MTEVGKRDAVLELISTIPLFNALSPTSLEKVVDRSSARHLVGGEILMREGESGDSMFVLCSGRLRAYVLDHDD